MSQANLVGWCVPVFAAALGGGFVLWAWWSGRRLEQIRAYSRALRAEGYSEEETDDRVRARFDPHYERLKRLETLEREKLVQEKRLRMSSD